MYHLSTLPGVNGILTNTARNVELTCANGLFNEHTFSVRTGPKRQHLTTQEIILAANILNHVA